MTGLEVVEMELDELEALRLSDVEGLSQSEAASRMNVSQSTFNRILSGARSISARALTEGVALKIARNVPHTNGSVTSRQASKASDEK